MVAGSEGSSVLHKGRGRLNRVPAAALAATAPLRPGAAAPKGGAVSQDAGRWAIRKVKNSGCKRAGRAFSLEGYAGIPPLFLAHGCAGRKGVKRRKARMQTRWRATLRRWGACSFALLAATAFLRYDDNAASPGAAQMGIGQAGDRRKGGKPCFMKT